MNIKSKTAIFDGRWLYVDRKNTSIYYSPRDPICKNPLKVLLLDSLGVYKWRYIKQIHGFSIVDEWRVRDISEFKK